MKVLITAVAASALLATSAYAGGSFSPPAPTPSISVKLHANGGGKVSIGDINGWGKGNSVEVNAYTGQAVSVSQEAMSMGNSKFPGGIGGQTYAVQIANGAGLGITNAGSVKHTTVSGGGSLGTSVVITPVK